MNEGENSGIPNSPNFSSPNISSNNGVDAGTQAIPTQQAITSSDISAMAGTGAGSVAAAAAAMPENDVPTAISSGPSLSASNSNSERNRFNFGSRRFRDTKSSQPSTPMFAGAPDYFNQAAGDIELSGYETEKKNKKPFIIGGAILAAIIVVVCVAIFVPKSINSSSVKKYEDLKQLVADYSESVNYYEAFINGAKNNVFSLLPDMVTEEKYNATNTELSSNYAKIGEFKQKLDKVGTVDIVDDGTSLNIKDQVNGLKSALNDRIAVYEEYSKVLTALNKAYYNQADNSSIEELKNSFSDQKVGADISTKVKNYYSQRKGYDDSLEANGCYVQQNTTKCQSIIQKISDLGDSYSADHSLSVALYGIVPEKTAGNSPTQFMNVIINATIKKDDANEKKD